MKDNDENEITIFNKLFAVFCRPVSQLITPMNWNLRTFYRNGKVDRQRHPANANRSHRNQIVSMCKATNAPNAGKQLHPPISSSQSSGSNSSNIRNHHIDNSTSTASVLNSSHTIRALLSSADVLSWVENWIQRIQFVHC